MNTNIVFITSISTTLVIFTKPVQKINNHKTVHVDKHKNLLTAHSDVINQILLAISTS